MSERFYCDSPLPDKCDAFTLSGTEGHHLVRVMRKRAGDALVLFDGTGREFDAVIQSVGRDSAELSIESIQHVDRERPQRIHLAVAIPKGDRQKVLLEKAVEIGVHRLIPLQTERSQQSYSAKSLERWQRYVIEASKQCRRNRLMQIGEISDFPKLATDEGETSRWIAHPYEAPLEEAQSNQAQPNQAQPNQAEPNHDLPPPPSDDVMIAIGPEGGFTEREVEMAIENGWRPLNLGPRILRVETAAIAAVCRFES